MPPREDRSLSARANMEPGRPAGHPSPAVSGGRPRILPTAFFASLFLAILGYLTRQALVSPDIQFLAPASEGYWIVHPDPLPGYREAIFVHRFTLPAAVEHYRVRIAAMREYTLTIDGHAQPKKTTTSNWKVPVEHDLGPLVAGSNELRIHVTTPEPPPALLVEGPEPVRSDERWTVILPPESAGEVPVAIAYRGEGFLSPKPNAFRQSPSAFTFPSGSMS